MTLQSLRIPGGWRLTHNTLWEFDPSLEQITEGFYGPSSDLLAIHEAGRFILDVEWRPFNDPNGRFVVQLFYSPFGRTERGRRIETSVEFRDSEAVRKFEATSRAGLVEELESLLQYGAETRREGN